MGGDVLASATGYVVDKIIIGPALGAVARKLAQREALAAEAAAAKAAEQQAKQERLSRDPQNGKINPKSISEAAIITQAEEAGLVNNPRRPDVSRGEPNLDFAVDGPEPYKYCDVKTPV